MVGRDAGSAARRLVGPRSPLPLLQRRRLRPGGRLHADSEQLRVPGGSDGLLRHLLESHQIQVVKQAQTGGEFQRRR